VVGDRVEVLTRLHDLFDQVERSPIPVWAVQVHLVSLSATDARDLGFDVTPALDVSVAFAAGSTTAAAGAVPGVANAHLSGGLDSVLRVARRDEGNSLIAEPFALLRDGGEAVAVFGEQVPVPKRETISDGTQTVTTVAYEMTQTGFRSRIGLRETGPMSALVTVELSNNRLIGMVNDEAPQLANEEHKPDAASVVSGGVYLLENTWREQAIEKRSHGLRFGNLVEKEKRLVQLWLRAVRVGGCALDFEAETIAGPQPTAAGVGPERLPPLEGQG